MNAITGRKDLARTSKTPGRTQLINFFALNGQQRLADLPGYGYAKVPEKMRDHWRQLLSRYVETRASLAGVVVVMDSRHPLTDFDWQMLEWTGAQNLPVHLLLTKADKLGRGESMATIKKVRHEVGEGVTAQLFSAVNKTGVDEARKEVLKMLATDALSVSSSDSGTWMCPPACGGLRAKKSRLLPRARETASGRMPESVSRKKNPGDFESHRGGITRHGDGPGYRSLREVSERERPGRRSGVMTPVLGESSKLFRLIRVKKSLCFHAVNRNSGCDCTATSGSVAARQLPWFLWYTRHKVA